MKYIPNDYFIQTTLLDNTNGSKVIDNTECHIYKIILIDKLLIKMTHTAPRQDLSLRVWISKEYLGIVIPQQPVDHYSLIRTPIKLNISYYKNNNTTNFNDINIDIGEYYLHIHNKENYKNGYNIIFS